MRRMKTLQFSAAPRLICDDLSAGKIIEPHLRATGPIILFPYNSPKGDLQLVQQIVFWLWETPSGLAKFKSQIELVVWTGAPKVSVDDPGRDHVPEHEACMDRPERIPSNLQLKTERMQCNGPSLLFCSSPGYEGLLAACPNACGICPKNTVASKTPATNTTTEITIPVTAGLTTTIEVDSATTSKSVDTSGCDCKSGVGPCRDDATGTCGPGSSKNIAELIGICDHFQTECRMASEMTVLFCSVLRLNHSTGRFIGLGGLCIERDAIDSPPNQNQLVSGEVAFRAFRDPGPGRLAYCVGLTARAGTAAGSFILPADANNSCMSAATRFGAGEGSVRQMYLPDSMWNAAGYGTVPACVASTTGRLELARDGGVCGSNQTVLLLLDGCQAGQSTAVPVAGLDEHGAEWTGACVPIDSCSDNPCGPNERCVDSTPSYFCMCADGFYRSIDSVTESECVERCRDGYTRAADGGCIATCQVYGCDNMAPGELSAGGYLYGEHVSCLEQPRTGDYACGCDPGYNVSYSDSSRPGGICKNDVECDRVPSPCHTHATCVDLDGSFRCEPCSEGWIGDGVNCLPSCVYDSRLCGEFSICDLDYGCLCEDGFDGDGHLCFDRNECHLPVVDPVCDSNAECRVTTDPPAFTSAPAHLCAFYATKTQPLCLSLYRLARRVHFRQCSQAQLDFVRIDCHVRARRILKGRLNAIVEMDGPRAAETEPCAPTLRNALMNPDLVQSSQNASSSRADSTAYVLGVTMPMAQSVWISTSAAAASTSVTPTPTATIHPVLISARASGAGTETGLRASTMMNAR